MEASEVVVEGEPEMVVRIVSLAFAVEDEEPEDEEGGRSEKKVREG
jgi:hypothetical protein